MTRDEWPWGASFLLREGVARGVRPELQNERSLMDTDLSD